MAESQQLLAEYARNGSDTAFWELVNRYVDLVHSTALRLVEGDTHRAQDVSQTVFVDLSRKARTLPADVSLGGWLHRNTCFAAATLMRGERRRQSRERQAVEMNTLQNHAEADFSQVAPILDEAINELGDADRTAILLRFFEQHDFRTVGEALGSNEDAARMRVTRALEKLATLLKRRGVTASSITLGVALGTNAVQAAPVGLAATISTAAAALAGTSIAATATATATKAIAMTTLQKTVIGTTLAVALGAGVYETYLLSRLREQNQTLQQQQAPLEEQIHHLQRDVEDYSNRLAMARGSKTLTGEQMHELLRLRGEVGRLRREAEHFTQLQAAAALSSLPIRPPANKNEFEQISGQMTTALMRIGRGLRQFMTNEPFGLIVDDQGHVNEHVFEANPSLPLNQFEILVRDAQHLASWIEQQPKIIIAKSRAPIEFNGRWTRFYLTADGVVRTVTWWTEEELTRDNYLLPDKEMRALAEAHDPVRKILQPALEAFTAANNGRRPADPTQLQPYVTTPEQQAVLQKEIESRDLTRPQPEDGVRRTYRKSDLSPE